MGEESKADDAAIKITYETIFELLRREKNREELQKISETFYDDAALYLEEKNKVFSSEANGMFSDAEKEKTIKQVGNIKRMITELFERREKKVIILALNRVRAPSSITDTGAMLHEEKEFFNNTVDMLSQYRGRVLDNVFSDKKYGQRQKELPVTKAAPEPAAAAQMPKDTKTIRMISHIPKFLGKELEVYGPFNPDDMASLPSEIANILIKKGRAEEVDIE